MINNLSVEELKFYRLLQKTFNKVSFLMHFNSNRQLYIDIDVSIYLSQFRLEMKYKSKKNHIVLDALFRLTSENEKIERSLEDILDFDNYHENIIDFFDDSNCYVFQDTLIVMSEKFKKKIKNDYQQEKM